jgi:hypothetical protein
LYNTNWYNTFLFLFLFSLSPYSLLTSIGVVINPNTFSGVNYPYKPQGIIVVERVD